MRHPSGVEVLTVTEQPEQTQRRPGERLMLWFLLAFSLFVLITALMTLKFESLSASGAFPLFIGLVMLGSTVTVLWQNRARYSALKIGEDCKGIGPFAFPTNVGIFAGILILYILLLEPLHFWLSSFLFLVGSFLFLKGADWIRAIAIAIGMLAVIYVLFQYTFSVILW
jgi:hypothetical protein